MRRVIIAVFIAAALCGLVSCGSWYDNKMCQLKGEQLGSEARLIGNSCVVKGWGVVM